MSKIKSLFSGTYTLWNDTDNANVRPMLRRKVKLSKEENAILDGMSGKISLTM